MKFFFIKIFIFATAILLAGCAGGLSSRSLDSAIAAAAVVGVVCKATGGKNCNNQAAMAAVAGGIGQNIVDANRPESTFQNVGHAATAPNPVSSRIHPGCPTGWQEYWLNGRPECNKSVLLTPHGCPKPLERQPDWSGQNRVLWRCPL